MRLPPDVQDVGGRVGGGRVLVDPHRARVRGKSASSTGYARRSRWCNRLPERQPQRSYVVVRGVEDEDRCHHEARLAKYTAAVPAKFFRRSAMPCTWRSSRPPVEVAQFEITQVPDRRPSRAVVEIIA